MIMAITTMLTYFSGIPIEQNMAIANEHNNSVHSKDGFMGLFCMYL